MIALRLLPLAIFAATAAQAGIAGSDVPPPREVQPVGFAPAKGPGYAPVTWRETPPVMMGSSDRYVPVLRAPARSACDVAMLSMMMRDDDRFADADAMFDDVGIDDFDDGFGF